MPFAKKIKNFTYEKKPGELVRVGQSIEIQAEPVFLYFDKDAQNGG
jgi:hypothetical protein